MNEQQLTASANATQRKTIQTLKAEITRFRTALTPFAKMGQHVAGRSGVLWGVDDDEVKYSHFADAAVAMKLSE